MPTSVLTGRVSPLDFALMLATESVDVSGVVEQAALKSVAVIATRVSDRHRMTDLLAAVGRGARGFERSTEFDTAGMDTDAVLLCHRSEDDRVPAPRLPTRLRGVRVIVVSDRDDEDHVVEALASGAHHVFRIAESDRVAQARLAAALRRHAAQRQSALLVAPFCFDLTRHHVSVAGNVLALKPREFDFAHYMFSNLGRLVTNAELLMSVWSLPPTVDARRIDTAACRVRKKMHLDDRTGWVLRRFRREGYGLYGDSRGLDKQLPSVKRRAEEAVKET